MIVVTRAFTGTYAWRNAQELLLLLDTEGYTERGLQVAWQQKTSPDIAASIIGFIRQATLGDALIPYSERVDKAIRKILSSRSWAPPFSVNGWRG